LKPDNELEINCLGIMRLGSLPNQRFEMIQIRRGTMPSSQV